MPTNTKSMYFFFGFSEIETSNDQFDGHESKPAISILAIVEKSQQTSNFRYFATYSFHVLTVHIVA